MLVEQFDHPCEVSEGACKPIHLIPALGIAFPITLRELEPLLPSFRYNDKNAAHGIVLHSPALYDPQDLDAYEHALADHTIEVDLQPGTLVVWDTAYHRARAGKVEAIDTTGFTRAAMFAGAGRPR